MLGTPRTCGETWINWQIFSILLLASSLSNNFELHYTPLHVPLLFFSSVTARYFCKPWNHCGNPGLVLSEIFPFFLTIPLPSQPTKTILFSVPITWTRSLSLCRCCLTNLIFQHFLVLLQISSICNYWFSITWQGRADIEDTLRAPVLRTVLCKVIKGAVNSPLTVIRSPKGPWIQRVCCSAGDLPISKMSNDTIRHYPAHVQISWPAAALSCVTELHSVASHKAFPAILQGRRINLAMVLLKLGDNQALKAVLRLDLY